MTSGGTKLRFRTAYFIAGAFSILLTIYFGISYITIKKSLIHRSDHEVYLQLDSILNNSTSDLTENDLNRLVNRFGSTGEARIGFKLFLQSQSKPLPSVGPDAIRSVLDSHFIELKQLPLNIRVGTSTLRFFERSRGDITVVAGIDTITFDEVFEAMLRTYIMLLLGGIVVSFILAIITADLALKPLKILVSSAMGIRNQNVQSDATLPTDTTTREINELATVINDILTERDRNIERLKNFTADAAHELRTPLTILKGELEVDLRTRPLSTDEKESLQSNLGEVHRLIKIVEDLMILARAEQITEQVSIHHGWKLSELISEILLRFDSMLKAKDIILIEKYSINPEIRLSRTEIERIIYNIMLNAIQYSSEGKTIEIETSANETSLVLSIRDHGIGMTSTEVQHVFDRFWRADRSRSRLSGGVGLGLAIAKTFADKNNIVLKCSSEVGTGTEMTCIIPRTSLNF